MLFRSQVTALCIYPNIDGLCLCGLLKFHPRKDNHIVFSCLLLQCFFDTPGLMLKKSGFPYNDMKVRMESAWSSVGLFDVLVIIFDVDRHLKR